MTLSIATQWNRNWRYIFKTANVVYGLKLDFYCLIFQLYESFLCKNVGFIQQLKISVYCSKISTMQNIKQFWEGYAFKVADSVWNAPSIPLYDVSSCDLDIVSKGFKRFQTYKCTFFRRNKPNFCFFSFALTSIQKFWKAVSPKIK